MDLTTNVTNQKIILGIEQFTTSRLRLSVYIQSCSFKLQRLCASNQTNTVIFRLNEHEHFECMINSITEHIY